MADEERPEWDYVIVGSGAGGGTLAARLVESGMRVFLLEAGGDPLRTSADGLPEDYEVPAFHAAACENPAMSWGFKVRHYVDEQRQARDPKYEQGQGVLYPRAAALGGCTAHNAMIFIWPHDSDWNHIAQVTGDRSWRASRMRRYAKRVEACHHRPWWRALHRIGLDFSGHGWNGWLSTERARPHEAFADDELLGTVIGTARTYASGLPLPVARTLRWFWNRGDPNARSWRRRSYEGICYTPTSTSGHRRTGTRERLLQAAAEHPGALHIELDALATRVIFAEDGSATGVEYLKGEHLYRAHAQPNARAGEVRRVHARREVILCGGAFNTPQLLMLSGVGPAQELQRHGISVRVDLPGVGRNLQDRYEVAVTHRMRRPWKVLDGARFVRNDPLWRRWQESRSGMYASNGAALAIACRSAPGKPEPDIFCMALLARFEGYFNGFSKLISAHQDYLTWALLKAHTKNRAGAVTLRSADPLDTPLVNFNYFEDGNDTAGEDLQAVIAGIRFVRRMTAPLIAGGLIAEEKMPGSGVQTDEEIADHVRNTAWGHHASCSCAIGPASENGVLDSNFSVHGVRRLRVVDASVFPRIPGFFIASAVYMIGEKAAARNFAGRNNLAQLNGTRRVYRINNGLFTQEMHMEYNAEKLMSMTQAELDDLFKASPAGEIPNGPAKGTAIIAPGTAYTANVAEMISHFGWQGKVFDAQKGVLKNRILAFGLEAIVAKVYKGKSWLDDKECIVLDYSETSLIAQWIRDEIRQIGPGFYLGKVYFGKKRLIDFCLQF